MANPTWPEITEGQWNLIATNVITGFVNRLKSKYKFYVTYNLTGTGTPVDNVKNKSPRAFEDSNILEISSTEGIDVYIWPEDANPDIDDVISDSIMVSI